MGAKNLQFFGFGDLSNFIHHPLLFLRERASTGKKVERLRLGPKHFVFVYCPEAAQEILLQKPGIYGQNRGIFQRIQPVTGERGLVQLEGRESQTARAKSRALFTEQRMASALGVVRDYTNQLSKELEKQSQIDPAREMTGLILKTALKIFLGIDSPRLVADIGARFLRLNQLCGQRMRTIVPLPLALPTRPHREILRLRLELRTMLAQALPESRGGVPEIFGEADQVLDQCLTFLFAGHETTSSSLAFSLLLLAQNPSYQDRIASGDEAMALLVYKESLRLFPPAYMLAREARAADRLQGLRVEKGDQVIIALEAMHRNEAYFPMAQEFRPDRFREKLKHKFLFIPFGAGLKSCVGERLAYLEATTVLQLLCRQFCFEASKGPIRAEALITLHPLAGQHLGITRRQPCVH